MGTAIEWTDAVWNPVTGCSKVSEGCRNCYAERMAKRLAGRVGYPVDEPFRVTLHPDRLGEPFKWRKPSRIFVNSMSDLFHQDVPFDFIDKVFAVMALCPQHTFQVLTKRPERMYEYMNTPDRDEAIGQTAMLLYEQLGGKGDCSLAAGLIHGPGKVTNLPGVPKRPEAWPLPNIWLGVSVENQKAADERIPLLLQTPAAVRFLSCEPLLGPVDLANYLPYSDLATDEWGAFTDVYDQPGVDWVIVGGESGPKARPMHPDWVRSLRDQCQAAGVPFFFKQWGEWMPDDDCPANYKRALINDYGEFITSAGIEDGNWQLICRVGKKAAGRLLDGCEWNEFPGGESA